MTTTATAPTPTETPDSFAARLKTLDWRRYVIYIGFVVIFVFFAVTLGRRGLPDRRTTF